jgi:hypothetical protein
MRAHARADGEIKDKDATDFKNSLIFGRIVAERLESGGLAIGSFFILVGFAGIAYWAGKQVSGRLPSDRRLVLQGDATLQKVGSKSNYNA